MDYVIEKVTPSSQNEMLNFLKKREDFTLFLLNNFENFGLSVGSAPYSGNFKVIKASNEVIGVFCLTKSGNLLVETDPYESLFEPILQACKEEKSPILGVIGNWNFCSIFWYFLKEKELIKKETLFTKETLYTITLEKPLSPSNSDTRLLAAEDYEKWKSLILDYHKEEGFPNPLKNEELLKQYLTEVDRKIIWGLFIEDQLISIARLNAMANGLGQLGGVYTLPSFRRKGYGKAMLQKAIWDAKHALHLHKLIIITKENNIPANRLYESLGAKQRGDYALLFGRD
jgi:predicted GNAT family acetyltransferase